MNTRHGAGREPVPHRPAPSGRAWPVALGRRAVLVPSIPGGRTARHGSPAHVVARGQVQRQLSARKASNMAETEFTTQQARVAAGSEGRSARSRRVDHHGEARSGDAGDPAARVHSRHRSGGRLRRHGGSALPDRCARTVPQLGIAAWMQAAMIEATEITDGTRVLEIGCGGYNAALLRGIVGAAGRVASVDIDPGAVSRATGDLVRDSTIGCSRVQPRVTIIPATRAAEAGPRRCALKKFHSTVVPAYPDPVGGGGAHAEVTITGREV